jgi:hypothetical protein
VTYLRRALRPAAIAFAVASLIPSPAFAVQPPIDNAAQLGRASFETGFIDMSTNWGEAKACAITPSGNRCYRSEKLLDTAEGVRAAAITETLGSAAVASSCASALKLYTGTSYSGTVVSFTTQGTWLNLATYGIDNSTSSYKVGACSSTFRDGVAGTGTTYPGSTTAGVQSPSMLAGWDNVISSVHIN